MGLGSFVNNNIYVMKYYFIFSFFFVESLKSKSTQMLPPQKGNSRVLFNDTLLNFRLRQVKDKHISFSNGVPSAKHVCIFIRSILSPRAYTGGGERGAVPLSKTCKGRGEGRRPPPLELRAILNQINRLCWAPFVVGRQFFWSASFVWMRDKVVFER